MPGVKDEESARILAAFPTGKSIPEPDFEGMVLEFGTQSSVNYAGATFIKGWKSRVEGT